MSWSFLIKSVRLVSRKEKMMLHIPEREQSPDLLRSPQPLPCRLLLSAEEKQKLNSEELFICPFCYDPSIAFINNIMFTHFDFLLVSVYTMSHLYAMISNYYDKRETSDIRMRVCDLELMWTNRQVLALLKQVIGFVYVEVGDRTHGTVDGDGEIQRLRAAVSGVDRESV